MNVDGQLWRSTAGSECRRLAEKNEMIGLKTQKEYEQMKNVSFQMTVFFMLEEG